MKDIPIHKLTDRATIGLEMHHTSTYPKEKLTGAVMDAHRDDHYIFFLMEHGQAGMMVDFSEVEISGQSVFYVLPGQVHQRIDHSNAEGWFMAVDTLLIPKECRLVFENQLLLQQPYLLDDVRYKQCHTVVELLHYQYSQNAQSGFNTDVMRSLLNAFMGMAACGYDSLNKSGAKHSRPTQIAQNFNSLVVDHFKTEKRPTAYAQMLNISESYLNEALNKATGFSVSYWITHEVILEAKRLLYYSHLNVKQIAHLLGYDDHTYFSRLFKKVVGVTPLGFRDSHRNTLNL